MAYTVDGEDFDYRIKLTIDNTKVPNTQTDYPALYDLSAISDSDFWSNIDSVFGDGRITSSNGTTRLPLGVDSATFSVGSETGIINMKAPSVSSSVDTDVYLYWGNATAVQPAANGTYGSENVWTSEVVMRCSLSEVGTTSFATGYKDSTSNETHPRGGQGSGSKIPTQSVGHFGLAQEFASANDDIIDFDQVAQLEVTDKLTMESMVNVTTEGGVYPIIMAKEFCYEMYFDDQDPGTPWFRVYHSGIDHEGGGAVINDGTWHCVAMEYEDGGDMTVYVDGVSVGNHSVSGTITNDAIERLVLGHHDVGTGNNFNGKMQEARISSGTLKQTGYFETMSNNLLSLGTFWSTGAVETPSEVTFVQNIIHF